MISSVHGRRRLKKEYAKLDDETRMAKEVALARHKMFCLRCADGTLDYHTDSIVYESEPLMAKCTGSSVLTRKRLVVNVKYYNGKTGI